MKNISPALISLILSRVKKPIRGFEKKNNPLDASYQQFYLIIIDLLKRGKSEDEIISTLLAFK